MLEEVLLELFLVDLQIAIPLPNEYRASGLDGLRLQQPYIKVNLDTFLDTFTGDLLAIPVARDLCQYGVAQLLLVRLEHHVFESAEALGPDGRLG